MFYHQVNELEASTLVTILWSCARLSIFDSELTGAIAADATSRMNHYSPLLHWSLDVCHGIFGSSSTTKSTKKRCWQSCKVDQTLIQIPCCWLSMYLWLSLSRCIHVYCGIVMPKWMMRGFEQELDGDFHQLPCLQMVLGNPHPWEPMIFHDPSSKTPRSKGFKKAFLQEQVVIFSNLSSNPMVVWVVWAVGFFLTMIFDHMLPPGMHETWDSRSKNYGSGWPTHHWDRFTIATH